MNKGIYNLEQKSHICDCQGRAQQVSPSHRKEEHGRHPEDILKTPTTFPAL